MYDYNFEKVDYNSTTKSATFEAVVENTSPYEFGSFRLSIALMKDGVVEDTVYASAYNWKPGDKYKFDFRTKCEFDTYKIDYTYRIEQ